MRMDTIEETLKNGETVLIRSVSAQDAQNMLDHLIISHEESYMNMNQKSDYWRSVSLEKEKEILQSFDERNNKIMLVATSEQRIIAGLGLVGSEGQFHRYNASLGMSLQKTYWNLGLGTHLMRLAIEQARIMGFHRIELSVRTYNESAIHLYEKFGFERVGLLKEVAKIDDQFVNEYTYQLLL